MTARAYVLIETSVGKTKDVVLALRKLEGMREVNAGDFRMSTGRRRLWCRCSRD